MPPLFVDVSNNNNEPVWRDMRHGGARGVVLKGSEGVDFRDRATAAWAPRARQAGLVLAWYHYARPDRGTDAAHEADYFADTVRARGGVKPADWRLILDIEEVAERESTQVWAAKFLRHLAGRFPRTRLLWYASSSFISDHLAGGLALEPWPLWEANYGRNDGQPFPLPHRTPLRRVAHQFTSRGHFPGCHGEVDVSTCAGFGAMLAHPILGRVVAPARVVRHGWPQPIPARL